MYFIYTDNITKRTWLSSSSSFMFCVFNKMGQMTIDSDFIKFISVSHFSELQQSLNFLLS